MEKNIEFKKPNITLGLSSSEAKKMADQNGPNEISQQKRPGVLGLFISVMSEPMLLLLLSSSIIYLFLGEIRDALMLSSMVVVVIGITFYQEKKTEKTLDALRKLSSPRALVIRDGKRIRISGKEIVEGDIILLSEGDRVPADALVINCENLSTDESMLTGESISVRKMGWDGKLSRQRPGGDDLPFVYSGSLVISGHGVAQVYATGTSTEMGKIGKSIETIKDEDILLRKETSKIVRFFTIVGIILCSVVVFSYAILRGDLLNGFLAGLTLSMSMLPEEFPVVLMIFLTLGAWRISKKKVLTRKASSIETLGAATVLCVDKTGTLTMNLSKLTQLWTKDKFVNIEEMADDKLPQAFWPLLHNAYLACQSEPYDPLEKEIHTHTKELIKPHLDIKSDIKILKQYPLTKDLTAISIARKNGTRGISVSSKGSPEAIIELCHLNKTQSIKIRNRVLKMAKEGLRVLGVAQSNFSGKVIPLKQHDFKFKFIGLMGFVDPIRPSVPASVVEAHRAGLRVIMITGDYPGTAKYIAEKIGIKSPTLHISGTELKDMSIETLRHKIKSVNIFARVVPEQKLQIVNALKSNGEIVAMTGDGVNDAPALKSAHIGIAMGREEQMLPEKLPHWYC